MKTLASLVKLLKEYDGITRKFILPAIIYKLRSESYEGGKPHSLGEDSAAITTNSDDLVLLTTDAIVESLCLNHPKAAGFNAVLANVMDIYAAGGHPTSFGVALSYSDASVGQEMLEGLIEGSHRFKIPIVRGHTNSESESTYIVGSATGTVKKTNLLTAGGAKSGDLLVLVYDSKGQIGKHYRLGWDAVTNKSSDEIVSRLQIMNVLAQRHLIHAAKDISTAGLVGTAGMMLEYSGTGGVLNLNAIEETCPNRVSLEDWLRMYISLGFLIAVESAHLDRIRELAAERGMRACSIGTADDSKVLRLEWNGEVCDMFDFSKGPLLTPKDAI